MKTILDVLILSSEFLKSKSIDNARRDVERLLAHILKMKRLDLYLQYDRPLDENELSVVREGVRRLSNYEPIQYIEGKVPFHHCSIQVNKSVLIPRPETELLTERVMRYLATKEVSRMRLLDLCSGSGCIGIALKKEFPKLQVTLLDCDEAALEVARQNALDNDVDVEIIKSDLFSSVSGCRFDCIVSNPPYISLSEYENLDNSVKLYEPKRALVGGATGLEFYELIASVVHDYLEKEAALFLEIGYLQREAIQEIFARNGFTHIVSSTDFSNRDRFLTIFQ